ncbi:MAG: hypothetical protein PCFJNLEI_03935 [Verrucomicrobiae bacterium]|nr:hypothetical protein [Verrucomicrobiae bacterium]
MAGPIIPGMRSGYRTTGGAFKWILLLAAIGATVLFFVFYEAMREADEIYDRTGFIPKPATNSPSQSPR